MLRQTLILALLLNACGGSDSDPDAGSSGLVDAGTMDAAAPAVDAGPDGSFDAGALDADTEDGGGRADDAGPPTVPSDCPFDGWCWIHPSPFGVALNDVWGAVPDDVWAVGPRGFIAHFDGVRWSVAASPPLDEDLRAVHGSRSDLVFAVGDSGVVLRWDGATWSRVSTASTLDLHDVFIGSDERGWAVGQDRVRMRWDGVAWSVYDTEPTFGPWTSLYGASPTDIWLGSARGGFDHWDGAEWQYVDGYSVFPWSIAAIWGSGTDDVWAASAEASHRVAHFDGRVWSSVRVPETPSPVSATTMGGRAADDVWLLGRYGRARWDGSEFAVVDTHTSSDESPRGVHFFASDGWAVGGSGRIFRNRGGLEWTLAAGVTERYRRMADVVPAAGGGVHLVGTDGIWRGDATSVTPVATSPIAGRAFEAAPGDLWLVGGSGPHAEVNRWDGTTLTPVTSDEFAWTDIADLWASASDDVYLAASDGTILRWDGTSVSVARDGGIATVGQVTAIDGASASDIFAVTIDGDIMRGSGTSWALSASDADVWWTSVRALAGDDVWVGGGGGTLWHFDGREWTPASVPDIQRPTNRGNSPYIVEIVGNASTGLTAISDEGHVLRLVGGTWVRDRTLPFRLGSAAVATDGAVWVVSDSNVLRR